MVIHTARVAAVAAALVLCAASAAKSSSYTPMRNPAAPGVSDGDVYAAAVQVFTDHGWSLRDRDSAAHTVSTEWIGAGEYSGMVHSWRAVASGGGLVLSIDCRTVDRLGNPAAICDGDKRADGWVQDQGPLLEEILVRARVLANSSDD